MDSGKNRLLTKLDNPLRIVIFTPAEIGLIMIPLGTGLFLGGWIGFIVSFSGFYLRKQLLRFQKKHSNRIIQGSLYWFLPPPKTKEENFLPLSYVREYVS
jgi:hypothetical protein